MKRILMIAMVALLAAAGKGNAAGLDFTLGQATIDMDLFYNGTSVAVDGWAPEGSQVVVRFIGQIGEATMKRKGKVMGLLWKNKDTLHFSNMPAVCLVESSAPLTELGRSGEKLGLAEVAESIAIEPASADRTMLLPELLKLKKSEGLYREDAGVVRLADAKDGRRAFSAQIRVPSRLRAGDYSVEVFAVRNGAVVAQGAKPIAARLAGAPAFVADLAFNHGLWYGILASVIAILAGLAVGQIFKGKGGAH